MKRTISVLVLAVLVLSLMLPSLALAVPTPDLRYVKTGNGKPLNVRNAPNGAKVAELTYRTQVLVHSTQGDWCLVEPLPPAAAWDTPLWVMKSFLVTGDPGPFQGVPSPTYEDVDAAVRLIKYLPQPYRAEICTRRPSNYVHLRWIPNTSARFIDKYLAGEEIEVLAESRYWAQVRIVKDGYVGFILRDNVNPLPDAVGIAQ